MSPIPRQRRGLMTPIWRPAAQRVQKTNRPVEVHVGRAPISLRRDCAHRLHRLRRHRAFPPLLHRSTRRSNGLVRGAIRRVAANSWVIINVGGGPTDDKPAVTLETPHDLNRVSSFLNIRVADIRAVYAEWSSRGAIFLTPPKQHETEIRCYLRDPDGHLVEVGQATSTRNPPPPS